MNCTREYIINKFYENSSSKTEEFMHIYPRILAGLTNNANSRGEKVVVLEIGNRNYETMNALLSISENIIVYGIDINNSTDLFKGSRELLLSKYGNRVKLGCGSQADKVLLENICSHAKLNYGGFDLVMDDGSHKSSHVLASFDVISSYMKEEGVYAVEDIECMYDAHPLSKLDAKDYWRYPDKYHSLTLRKFIKKLTDVVNRDFFQRARLAKYNRDNNIPRRSSRTLGDFTLLGRDDLISSYQVYANCLVMYFGYNLSKPVMVALIQEKAADF